MDIKDLLTNKAIPKEAVSVFERLVAEGHTPKFAIVGDMSRNGKFLTSVAYFNEDRVTILDGEENTYLYRDLKSVVSKRMYGNSTLSAVMPDGKRTVIFRYTYSIAGLCDAAAMFINHLNDGQPLQEEFGILGVAFEGALSICPKCGRRLLHPGAECIMCQSKTGLVRKFSRYLKPQLCRILISLILAVLSTAMALVPPAITGFIVDNVFPGGTGLSDIKPLIWLSSLAGDSALGKLTIIIGALLLTYILQYAIGTFRALLMRMAGETIVSDMRKDIFAKAQYLPMRFYDKSTTGGVINRVNNDAETLKQFMLRLTQEVVVNFFQMIGIVVIMLTMNPLLTLYSLVPIPVIIVATKIFSGKVAPYYHRIWNHWSKVSSVLTDSIPCIRVIKSFTGEKKLAEKYRDTSDRWLAITLKLGKITTVFPQAVSFFTTCGSLVIWAIGGARVIEGVAGYSAGLIVTFISYASMFYGPVSFFANMSDTFQNALSAAERVLDVLDAEPEQQEKASVMPDAFKGRVEFNHVSFSFDRSRKILDDVSFAIEPGEVVGIVGTTGAGKSTLVNLLMRFYTGYSGEILVDGHNINYYDLEGFRQQIGYVQQDPMMFSDTIFNNISFGKPGASAEEVIEAANIANAHGFIVRQPDGYDTVLGERGVGVSGGERQRLSIARAVLKNPSLLVFDEATAAVDSETEKLIQDAIDNLIVGKTTFMIAHRLSTLKKANRILVIDNGKLIENGTPAELMEKKGKYYKLVQIQTMRADADQISREERL